MEESLPSLFSCYSSSDRGRTLHKYPAEATIDAHQYFIIFLYSQRGRSIAVRSKLFGYSVVSRFLSLYIFRLFRGVMF
jgi:hypothetical protein